MKIISSINIPPNAISKLKNHGIFIPFETKGITYSTISNHPDVFLCNFSDKIIIAPNTPSSFKKSLTDNKVIFTEGQCLVGNNYPETASYNAVVTDKYIIHNLKITDNAILKYNSDKQSIHVNQAYTRCNLLPLKNDSFITSDKGIYNTLVLKKLNVLFVNPAGIILPDYNYGFFGGACGVYHDNIFIVGSLSKFNDGEKVRGFLRNMNYNIIELYDGELFDCGSLIFVD